MKAPLPEQQWSDELKGVTQRFSEKLETHVKELDEQLHQTEERTREMLRATNRQIADLFHEKMEAALTQMNQQEQERRLLWKRQCEETGQLDLTEPAKRLADQVLGHEGACHD